MTGVDTVAPRRDPLAARLFLFVRNLPRRVHERAFWVTQAGVVGITVVHAATEAWSSQGHGAVSPAFHHIPAVLYVAPIIYASLRYGTEGTLLTGAWSALLTLPNLAVWHREDLEWLSELVYVSIVISIGAVTAVLVERERDERRRAEATSHRLALLDGIASLTLTAPLDQTVDETLARLVGVLGLEQACVVVTPPDGGGVPSLLACRPAGHELPRAVLDGRGEGGDRCGDLPPGVVTVPLVADLPGAGTVGHVEGQLVVRADDERALSAEDHRLLVGVASHLAIAVASAQLQESERDRVRSYAQLVTQAQEEERSRIARELHDEAAQDLVAVRRDLGAVATQLEDHPMVPELHRIGEVTRRTLAGMRRFSQDLRPPMLDDLGLASALEAFVDEFRERTRVVTWLEITGSPRRLPTATELAVFRIGQAALHNVEHHAAATRVDVELAFEPERVRLQVVDDGLGFDRPERLDELVQAGKLGVIGMRERARLVGGDLELDSRPGAGTCVRALVPAPVRG